MMRIFVVLSHIGGGGAERVGVLIAGGLAQRGHEVYLVTNLHDEVKYPVDDKVKILNMVTSSRNKLMKWVSAFKNLRRLVKQHQPDVIIGIMQLSSFISKLACIGTKTHVIMTEHDSFERPPSAPMSKMESFCKFYLNCIYECVTVITQADKDFIGNRLKNVHVMPNPLLLQPVNEILQKEKVIIAAGRLGAWHCKGFDVLIKAWAKVVSRKQVSSEQVPSEQEPETLEPGTKEFGTLASSSARLPKQEPGTTPTGVWRLQIAGTGSEESLGYLKNLCKENGVEDSVDFLGFVSDMESLYKKASVFVLSSRYEGFGLVLIEAMSQGCACIACDYKGRQGEIFGELKNEKVEKLKSGTVEVCNTGILCPPEDVEALAAAMAKMIEDDEYRESVRGNAIERSEYYDIKNIARQWEELLNRVVK